MADTLTDKLHTCNYQKYNSKNPFTKLALSRFFKSLGTLIEDIGILDIVDMGCGEGNIISYLKRSSNDRISFKGIDYNYEVLLLAKSLNPNEEFIQGDIYNVPFKDKSFGLVICLEVLEHLNSVDKALAELTRVARKYCLVSIPYEPYFSICRFLGGKNILKFGKHPEHINCFGIREIKEKLSAYFELRKTVILFPWILFLGEVR